MCTFKLYVKKELWLLFKKVKENSSVNNEKDVQLELIKVRAQKCFSKYFFRWFVPDKLWDIIPKETSNNAVANSSKINGETEN